MRPRYVLFENVEGIISAKTADGESVLKYVLGDLEERGYSCTWGVFSASETGAPHQRKRVFILGKLSDTASQRREVQDRREHTSEQVFDGYGSSGGAGQLAYTKGNDEQRCDIRQREVQSRGSGTQPEELGNTSSERSCGGCEDSDRIKSEMLGSGLGKTRWPSRPGQQQYEWEEPRVTEAQSCVGLSANGTAFRVDRLRLLGNGVVPDTCELAFKTLIQQL
jgi:DNA (cytosine-5)-methyltransferase 1